MRLHTSVLFYSFTKERNIVDFNQNFAKVFGMVKQVDEFMSEETLKAVFNDVNKHKIEEITFLNGHKVIVSNLETTTEGLITVFHITARYTTDQDTDHLISRHSLDILNHFPLLLLVLNNQLVINLVKGNAKELVEYSNNYLLDKPISAIVDDPSFLKLQTLVNEVKQTVTASEITLLKKSGTLQTCQIYLKKSKNSFFIFITSIPQEYFSMTKVIMDISASLTQLNLELLSKNRIIEKQKIELEKLSMTDNLTGLFNRRYFHSIIKKKLRQANQINQRLVLALLDLNNFKRVNDQYGHDAGDGLLKTFSQICKHELREESDLAFRFGGDEFVLLLSNCDEEKAKKILNRINKLFTEKTDISSISYGLVPLPNRDKVDIRKYLKIADERMYASKKESKNES